MQNIDRSNSKSQTGKHNSRIWLRSTRKLEFQGLYQNHAGQELFWCRYLGSGRSPRKYRSGTHGGSYDIRHATVEAGLSWPTSLRRISSHIRMLYVKDFRWVNGRVVNVPLGTGHVDPAFFRRIAEDQLSVPISLHIEYLDHRSPQLVDKHLDAMKQDLATLRTWLKQ